MDRRSFLGKFGAGALTASAGVLATTVHARSRDTLVDGAKQLQAQLESVAKRVDSLDESHRRMFKMLIMVASVSTGLDVLTLLKGDILS
jgi:hypothetical protein